MRTARTRLAFSVLIVIAMVSSGLGVGALMRSTGPAVSGPTGTVGTRSDGSSTVVSLAGMDMNEEQEESLLMDTSAANNDVAPTQLSKEEIREGSEHSEMGGSITATVVSSEEGTRNPYFSAGGPYGGPNCLEGSCTVHFEVSTDDPTLIFFRWDFNNDGAWDTTWLSEPYFDETFGDNYYGQIVAEGWDGISIKTTIFTGYNLYPLANYYWGFTPANVGWKFRAKTDMDATELGFYRYYYAIQGLTIRLWDFATKAQLGICTPSAPTAYAWYWCTLPTPVHFTQGKEYMISYHKNGDSTSTGYWVLFNNPSVTWEKVEYQNMWYVSGLPQRMPTIDYGSGTTYVPMLDFKWRYVLVEPLTSQAKAFLDVNNVAPQPFGLVTDPSPGLEGTPVKFSAWFNDPGLDDDWQFRWYFGDGSWSPWQAVKKFAGGAKVLLYHTNTGVMATFKQALIDQCGAFCITVDEYDFGPLGFNAHMTLSQLMAYDVIWVDTYYGPLPDPVGAGNLLADYMDAKGDQGSGGVVVNGRGPYYSGSTWEIRGRYFTDQYSPLPSGTSWWSWSSMGTIYVPGHPILDGVTSINAYARVSQLSVNPGAIRVADFVDGRVMLATKENPKVNNGARAVGMPYRSWGTECTGDCVKVVYNAIKWASRMSNPAPLPMPMELPWISHFYKDDDPVTTSPEDYIDIKVEVKDDDHLKVEGTTTLVSTENFQSGCSYPSWPAGWVASPSSGWRCQSNTELSSNSAVFRYYYNDYATSLLTGPVRDLGAYNIGKLEWRNYWYANYGGAYQDGYVEISTDGGLTFPYIIKEFHHNQPGGPETKVYTADIPAVSSSLVLRFRIDSGFDWYWIVDDIKLYGTQGRTVWGLGEAWGRTAIANVPPSIVGGPQSGLRTESQDFEISGMQISDPALMEPTEWFAYKVDYDDGTPANWVYKGTLAPPKLNILWIHHACTSGNTCTSYTGISNRLLALDLVGSVTGYNFFQSLSAPTLAYMLQFDVIMYGGEWAYLGNSAYDAARVLIGNRMADYLDQHRGGVVTFMATYDLSSAYGEIFSLLGKYIDLDYGPFDKAVYPFGAGTMGTVHYPDHPIMKGVSDMTSATIHSGSLPTTAGGLRLASWTDGGAAVGAKDYNNDGRRSCALNVYTGGYGGNDASKLLRQCIGWVYGNIPTPDIPPVRHIWGDNGGYVVDVTLIDDDMGWTWDPIDNVPVASPLYPQILAHHYIPVSVENVDPTIQSTAAYTDVDLCIRMTGNKGNDATLTVMGTDGSYYTVTTTRVPGNPAIGCLPKIRVDMTIGTEYQLDIAYDPTGDDGANPEWIFAGEFPDGKIKELRHTFNSNDGPQVWTIGNKEFKRLAIGSPLTFEASASDPGSDDLAFAWVWSDLTPYDIHIYAHPGYFYGTATSDKMDLLPFLEPMFDFYTNDERSPEYDPIRANDKATHTFAESQMPYFLYVTLIVMDDDVIDPYPSLYEYPGMDIEMIPIDW